MAAQSGHVDVIRVLVKHKADVNQIALDVSKSVEHFVVSLYASHFIARLICRDSHLCTGRQYLAM